MIVSAAAKSATQAPYPANNYLAAQLKTVARLIAGGLKTKVYMVSMGGFDTHGGQVQAGNTATGNHAQLLKQVSEAISAFQTDVSQLGIGKRVMGMTFSEFGRRIKSNGSAGTDHGAAQPVFYLASPSNREFWVIRPTCLRPLTRVRACRCNTISDQYMQLCSETGFVWIRLMSARCYIKIISICH
ncbi:MAG: DUF1501 domain-containing protein [Puia sp.]